MHKVFHQIWVLNNLIIVVPFKFGIPYLTQSKLVTVSYMHFQANQNVNGPDALN